ncbi:hypothetical protein BKA65DRAFT_201680 [Rhexocercosporidium sp. MPI-PUGE-AT-0058]|nr:hypothetical protein BKA65DRAFT_201680 [Rhexocercosporidium sp. MPI-PUGE-AT-0058]
MTSRTILLCLLASAGAVRGGNAIPSYDDCVAKCQENSFCQSAFFDKGTGDCQQYDCLFEGTISPSLTEYVKPGSSNRCPSNIPLPTPAEGESSTSGSSLPTSFSSSFPSITETSTSISVATAPTQTQDPTAATTSSPAPSSSTSTGAAPPSRWSKSNLDISGVTNVAGTCLVLLFLA